MLSGRNARRPGRPLARVLAQRVLALVLLGLVAGLGAGTAHAQTGKFTGHVLDEAGQPLVGATVFVMGTELGAAVDMNGEYVILRIPPGTFTVRVSSVGFQTQMIEGVRSASNQTTTLDVTLREETIEGEEVTVLADRPVIDVAQTSSIATIGRDEIAVLPVQEVADIVNLQAGVVDGHFRGGRLGEVQYQVDGITVNNPYDNTSSVQLDRSVLQEVQVISGTFDAEYGQALSGVVNAVLRSGDDDRYEFSAEVFAGDYVSPGNDSATVLTRAGQEVRVGRYPFIDDISPTTLQNYQFSFSGPLPVVPRTTFLLNGQRNVDEGYLYGTRLFVPTDSNNVGVGFYDPTGDGAVVPMQFERRWSFLGKVTNTSIRNVQLSYQAIGNSIDRRTYNHGFRYNPDGVTTPHEFSIVHGLDVTHVLSARTFYEVGVRQNYFDYHDYLYADATDPRYFEAGIPVAAIPNTIPETGFGAIVQGLSLNRFVQRTNALVFKGALTTQITNVHLVKAGVEFQRSALDFGVPGLLQEEVNDLTQVVELGVVTDTVGAVVNHYAPFQAAAFVQDRIEWGDLRVRIGLRLEYFDANATVPGDLQNPANSITGAPPSEDRATTVKWALAPRLGVSFPILNRASLFFSYGHFYQMPGLKLLFGNADYSVLRDLQANDVRFGILGNPDLNPEFTAQYEFGFKSELMEDVGLDVSLFYKDVRDLLGVAFVPTYTAAYYARYTNTDFGDTRGFTVALDHRALGPLSVTLDYTYQEAVGNASDPAETATRAEAEGNSGNPTPFPVVSPFNWDQRHTLNATALWARPRDFAVTGVFRLGSGTPYTPALGSGFGADLEPNSGRKPGFFTVDLRAEKFFRLGGTDLTTFARVFNLFDSHFTNGFVYDDTGSPFYTLDPIQQQNPDPHNFASPRRIEVGLSLRGFLPR